MLPDPAEAAGAGGMMLLDRIPIKLSLPKPLRLGNHGIELPFDEVTVDRRRPWIAEDAVL